MGNAPSAPEEPEPIAPSERPSNRIPKDWNNGQNFVMISPQSDLSNPSQFRHRLREGHGAYPVHPALQTTMTSRPHAPRQTQRRSGSAPPPPAKFYFEQENQPQAIINKRENRNKKPEPIKKSEKSKTRWITQKKIAVKNKARRAKRVFKGCWEDQKEVLNSMQCCAREKDPEHERLPSYSPRRRSFVQDYQSVLKEGTVKHDVAQLILPLNDEDRVQTRLPMGLKNDMKQSERGSQRFQQEDSSPPLDREPLTRPSDKRNDVAASHPYREPTLKEVMAPQMALDPQNSPPRKSSGSRPAVAKVRDEIVHVESEVKSMKATGKPDIEITKLSGNVLAKCKSYEEIANKENTRREKGFGYETKRGHGKSLATGYTKTVERRSSFPQAPKTDEYQIQDETAAPLMPSTIKNAKVSYEKKDTMGKETAYLHTKEPSKTDDTDTSVDRNEGDKRHIQAYLDAEGTEKDENRDVQCVLQGSTIRQMLLQTYRLPGSEESSSVDRPRQDETLETGKIIPLLMAQSPASITGPQTPESNSRKQLVSRQAIQNATFLFSPSYADGDQELLRIPAPHKGSTPFAISTASSQNRLVSRPRADPQECFPTEADSTSSSARRVRFSASSVSLKSQSGEYKERASETSQPLDIQVHSIPRSLSDLSDNTALARESASSIPAAGFRGIKPIIEEEEGDGAIGANESHESYDPPCSVDSPPEEDEETQTDDDVDQANEEEQRDPSFPSTMEYPTNWSYAVDMDNGVTPLRDGKFASNATHSPFLRFKEAKKKFSGESDANLREEKRVSDDGNHEVGLVRSRIIAMEEMSFQSKHSRETSNGHSRTSSRETLKNASISSNPARDSFPKQTATRKPSLVSISDGSVAISHTTKTKDTRGGRMSGESGFKAARRSSATNGTNRSHSDGNGSRSQMPRGANSIRISDHSATSKRSTNSKSSFVGGHYQNQNVILLSTGSQPTLSKRRSSHSHKSINYERESMGSHSCGSFSASSQSTVKVPRGDTRQTDITTGNQRESMGSQSSASLSTSSQSTLKVPRGENNQENKSSSTSIARSYTQNQARGSTGSGSLASHSTTSQSTLKVPRALLKNQPLRRSSSGSYDADASRLSNTDESQKESIRDDMVAPVPNLSKKRVSFGKHVLTKFDRLPDSVQSSAEERLTPVSDIMSTAGSELDTTVDDFAALLQNDGPEDGDDDSSEEESYEDATVSTVHRVQEVERMISGIPGFSEADDTTFCSESLGTVSTVRQRRQTSMSGRASSTLSSVMKEEAPMAFRQVGAVRPNEQLHRTVPGSLQLSPLQKTPMEARKWRALAAAAQEKTSSSKSKLGSKPRKRLSERETNILLS